jgi:hypothetical protein
MRIKPRYYVTPENLKMKELLLANGLVALVDDADYPALSAHEWYAYPGGYVMRTEPNPTKPGSKTTIYAHRVITGCVPGDGVKVDHRDGIKLNCQRGNLRRATPAQNKQNTPAQRNNACGLKGVCLHKQSGRWQAQIKANGRVVYLGLWGSPRSGAPSLL